MKKILFLVAAVFALCTSYVFATNSETQTSTSQVCQFSLNHYTGTITSNNCTQNIQVRLNCARDADVTATVFVYIDGELVASDLYTIYDGDKSSGTKCIQVPLGNKGKKYTLKVQ